VKTTCLLQRRVVPGQVKPLRGEGRGIYQKRKPANAAYRRVEMTGSGGNS